MDPLRQQILKALRAVSYEGLRSHEIADALTADRKGTHRVRSLLDELVADGTLEKGPGARYRLAGSAPPEHIVEGKVQKWPVEGLIRVHPSGFGFVTRDDGGDDVYVGARWRGNALDGDRVGLTTWVGFKGTEGRVEQVLERGRARLTGIVRGRGSRAFLEPDDPRVQASFTEVELEGLVPRNAEDQAVLAEIVRYPEKHGEPLVATLRLVIGRPESLDTEITKILVIANIETEFMPPVVTQAVAVPTTFVDTDLENRTDLSALHFMTIDPETARDFDDAICVDDSPRPGCDRVWVAVADVSHYVRPGTPIDDEAQRRGCSVYLPDRAIPMLPKELSAGICSLNPDVDRCAMVARFDVDAEGAVHDEHFCAAKIRSRARLDYSGVAAALKGDFRGDREKYRPHLQKLERLERVASRLRARRMARGSLDLDLPEAKIILDEDDRTRIRDVVQSRADPAVKGAYQLVEDFMLAANEAVARRLRDRAKDALWRIHEPPSAERLETFAAVAGAYGIRFDVEEGRDPKRLKLVLASLVGKPMEQSLSILLLRSLKQAKYDIVNVGHFGLAAPDYVHFTSPIRRYPDLVIHRLMKQIIAAEGGDAGGRPEPVAQGGELQRVANASSASERRAMEAERDVVDLFRSFFMRDRVGEELDGKVTGVTGFGAFVTIEHPYVEGLIRTETLDDDRYVFDDRAMRLVGQNSNRSLGLGDKVRVRIAAVSLQRRKIDMQLVARPEPRVPTAWLEQEAEYERNRVESRRQIAAHAAQRAGRPGPNDTAGPSRKSSPFDDKPARHAGKPTKGGKGKASGKSAHGKSGHKKSSGGKKGGASRTSGHKKSGKPRRSR